MIQWLRDLAAVGGFAIAGLAVVLAPALAAQAGGVRTGVGSIDEDILLASAAVGAVEVVAVGHRALQQRRARRRRLHVWIASLNALVVLALSASLLVLVILHAFPDEHASLADHGAPLVALWAGVQLVAVLLSELTARIVLWWLADGDEARPKRPSLPSLGSTS